eukprot:GHVN01011789.1.p1 GENE.GHVN01011789.1~~GHVN01011789.1.p1  ORF type:complete len:228 (+),score=59.50 GHVN01011789.1:956-1639(+)
MGDCEGESPVSWGWHSKVMTRYYPSGLCASPLCDKVHGWAYIGSHNCSAASWGTEKFFKGIEIRNFELGVVITSTPARFTTTKTCGDDLSEVAPPPWRSVETLEPYHPPPQVTGLVRVMGVVSSSEGPFEQIKIKFTSCEGEKKELSIERKRWFRSLVGDAQDREWPPGLGASVLFDYSDQYGLVCIIGLVVLGRGDSAVSAVSEVTKMSEVSEMSGEREVSEVSGG